MANLVYAWAMYWIIDQAITLGVEHKGLKGFGKSHQHWAMECLFAIASRSPSLKLFISFSYNITSICS